MKLVNVTFDYNPETEAVSNVTCSVDGIEKKKRTTRKKKDIEEEVASEPIISLEANRIVFNSKAALDLEIEYQDRVVIEWEKGDKKMYPTIRRDEELGNKITKSNTMTYKGKANAVLAELGNEFTLAPHKEGCFKLVSISGSSELPEEDSSKEENKAEDVNLEAAIEKAESVEPEIIVDTDENNEIDDLTFKL